MYKVKKETIIAQIDFIREMHKINMTNVYLVKRYANLYCFYELLSAISGDEKSYIRYIEERRKEWIPIIVPDFMLIEKVRKEGVVKLMKLDKTDIDTYEREMKKIRHRKYIDYLKKLDRERIKSNEKNKKRNS